jgi:hypothetical protein
MERDMMKHRPLLRLGLVAVGLAVFPVAVGFAQAVSFGPATNFPVGSGPFTVAIGDLNGDGYPDLATANQGTDDVSILLGDGTGSFGAATNFTVGDQPVSVAIGDLNGDGRLDLAVANIFGPVSILLGDGTGSFGSPTNFAVSGLLLFVAIGDLNGNGKPDLVLANQSGGNVRVLLGDGTGSFSAATSFAAGQFPRAVAIGDLNGDVRPDLAVANFGSDNVSILLGNGTGSFSAAANFGAGDGAISVAIGDLNGDGKPDLAVANINSDNVSILFGNGTGSFSAATNLTVGDEPFSVAIADLNGDGNPDAAVTNDRSSSVSILLGDGTGAFSPATNFAAGWDPLSVKVGDLNGDGKPDLAVANGFINNVSILLNTTSANTAPTVNLTGQTNAFEGDLTTYTFEIVDSDPGDTFTMLSQTCGLNGTLSNPTFSDGDPAGTYSFDCSFPDGPDTSQVSVQVRDSALADSNLAFSIVTVINVTPTITLSGAPTVSEGLPYALNLGAVVEPGSDAVASYTIHWGDASETFTGPPLGSRSHTYADGPYNHAITVDLIDEDGTFPAAGSLMVTVDNVAPTITAITAPLGGALFAAPTAVGLSASFTDPGTGDTHTCAIDWDDMSGSSGTVSEDNGSGTCADTHVFGSAGVYTIVVTVTDDDGAPSEYASVMAVVYDPSAGFVTGGGWITSPPGAYFGNPSLTGKAHFGFVSKYQKGVSTPVGQTEFQFQLAAFNFHSDTYQWLVVSGPKAQYKGTGTVNGAGSYGFLLTATDGQRPGGGGLDRFRIKVWDVGSGMIVYDNVGGSDDIDLADPPVIGGGSVVIHTK